MLSKLSRPCGPRRLDPNQAAKVREQTLSAYRKSGRQFADWASELNYEPQGPGEWDDLLVEWKNECSRRHRSSGAGGSCLSLLTV